MLLWLTVALIMTNAYKSKLTSILVNSNGEQYTAVDQLVYKKYQFYVSLNIQSKKKVSYTLSYFLAK